MEHCRLLLLVGAAIAEMVSSLVTSEGCEVNCEQAKREIEGTTSQSNPQHKPYMERTYKFDYNSIYTSAAARFNVYVYSYDTPNRVKTRE